MTDDEYPEIQPVHMPIDGVLDLHTFKPGEIGSLVPEYLKECHKQGIYHIRIIHGKGTGSLRQGVHKILSRLKMVESFKLGDETSGSWGATLVELKK